MQRYEYEITALPSLPPLGEEPPVTLQELRELLDHHPMVRRVLTGILLAHDVELLISMRARQKIGELPFVLTPAQLSDEQPLPDFLVVQNNETSADKLWESYFHHLAALGLAADAHILPAWAHFEVTLRNAVAERRSRLAGHPLPPAIVAEELCSPLTSVTKELDAWAAAPDPLSAHRTLMAIRRAWIDQHQTWYSFGIDEIAAYALEWLVLRQAYVCQSAHEEAA